MTYDNAKEATDNTLSSVLPTRSTVDQTMLSLVVVSPVSSLLDVNLGLKVSHNLAAHRRKTYGNTLVVGQDTLFAILDTGNTVHEVRVILVESPAN
jgi:hypothetical protein